MRKIIAGLVVVCLIMTSLYQQPVKAPTMTRYVNAVTGTDGAGTNQCDNPSIPCKTITNAIIYGVDGDTILVAAGYYNESLVINESLSLRGAGANVTTIGSGQTKIDVSGSSTNIITVNISGFTIKLGTLYGINFYYASGAIENNIIKDHDLDGIRLNNCDDVRIIGNLITHNGWMNGPRGGSGIYVSESNPVIQNNVITGNYNYGVDISSGSPIITNNTIVNNGPMTTHALSSQTPKGAGPDGAGIVIGNLGAKITNNIVAFNVGYGIYGFDPDVIIPDITYNDVYGNSSGNYGNMPNPTGTNTNGNISSDPQFGEDYHLLCSSPAINAGTNSPPGGLPSTDKDGNPRIIGGIVDMGAYETACNVIVRPPPQTISNQMIIVATGNVIKAEKITPEATNLLARAKAKGLDTSTCEKLIEEAQDLISEAKKVTKNPIYANNLALQAMEKLKQATDCLKALLG
jgi:parallel beta-helix repeat protein